MYDFTSKKHKKLIGTIGIILIVAMVVTTVLAAVVLS